MKKLLISILLATPLVSQAAPIIWGAPTDVTGELTDFSANGTFHEGYSGDSVDVIVDAAGLNLTFVGAGSLPNGVFANADPATRINADYDTLLQNATWSGSNSALELGTQTPLQIGFEYEVQVWVADTRGCCANRQKSYGDTVGVSSVTLNSGAADGADTDYVIGTFVADTATQTLSFVGSGAAHPQYNAIMVREIGAPVDSDNDGLPDDWETDNGLDPNDNGSSNVNNGPNGDPDNDGSLNIDEYTRGTNPQVQDSDSDGFHDGAETGSGTFVSYNYTTNTGDTGTDPLKNDTDGDGFLDGVESGTGTFVDLTDTGTNPNLVDTDGDTFSDFDERQFDDRSSDPTDINSVPNLIPIVWGDPQDVTGTLDDFLQTGSLVHAWSGDNAEVYVAGIDTTFTPGPNLSTGVFGGADPIVHDDGDYDALLQNATWGPNTQSIEIPDLTPGTEYSVQLWIADTRDCCGGRAKTYSSLAAAAPEVTLSSGSTDGLTPSQFVIGRFTANSTIQDLTFVGTGGTDHPQYNAIQVRTFAPEDNSAPIVHSVTHDGNQTILEWNSREGASYILEYQETLGGSWQELDDNVPSGGATTTYTDLIGARLDPVPLKGFYRVTQAP